MDFKLIFTILKCHKLIVYVVTSDIFVPLWTLQGVDGKGEKNTKDWELCRPWELS